MCVLPLFVHVLSMIVLYVCAVMTHQDSTRDLQFGPEARGPGVLRETGPGCGGRGGAFPLGRTICLPSLYNYVIT